MITDMTGGFLPENQVSDEQYDRIVNENLWQSWSAHRISIFQLNQNRMMVPLNKFVDSLEEVLKRPISLSDLVYHIEQIRSDIKIKCDESAEFQKEVESADIRGWS